MKYIIYSTKKPSIIAGFFLFITLALNAQLADVRYSVRVGNILSREGGFFGPCFEFGTEEYTAFGGFYDNTNNTVTRSSCLTCNNNGNCNYGGGTFIGTRTNNAYNLNYWLFAFENDAGSRCSYNSGDDCRYRGSPGFVRFREVFPSNNSYTVGPQANAGNSHAIRLDWTWRYTGNANSLNPGCSSNIAGYSSGAIRSWSVPMTAGRTYQFSTIGLSGEDTYIRIYSTNGYSIVASNDDFGGTLQSQVNYTPSSSGTYYVEISRFSRNRLNAGGSMRYQDISTPSINGGSIAGSTTICNGGNASISNSSNASGGFDGNLSYQWQVSNNGSSWSNISGATSSTYSTPNLSATTFYRRVATDCKGTQGVSNVVTVTVVADPVVTISSTAPNATICVGGTTSLTANISGGTGSFSYQWQYFSNGNWLNLCPSCTNASQNASPSATLDYRVIVSNGLGCNAIASQTVTVVPDPVITISGTDVTCNGADDGTASASISGGTNQSYNVNWFSDDGISSNNNPTGDGTFNVSDLEPNIWVVQTVGQQYGCFASASIVINEPAPLTATSNSGSILCNGGTTSVTINASGGTAPYSYAPVSAFINEIHYDNAGADQGEAIEIAGTAGLDLNGWSICLYNGNGGSLYNTRNLSGVISNSSNGFGFVTESISGIQNGSPDGIALVNNQGTVVQFLSYEGSFAASNGPAAGLSSTNIGVSEASSTSVGFSLQLQGSGSSYADFTWASPQANTFGSANTGQSFAGSGSAQTSNVINNVSAGSYTYQITDANGCTAFTDISISEPSQLNASSSSGAILCFGGTTTVTVSGSGGTAPYTGTGTYTVSAGTYSYTVTDANGCTANTSITVTEPSLLEASSSSGAILCFGGTTTVTVSGSGGTAPYTGTGTFTVSAGTYSYTVTDANGCTANTSITVTEPSLLEASSSSGAILCFGGTTTVTVSGSGGTAPYTGTGTFTVSAGTYSYTVTDANGCTSNTSITVTEPSLLEASSSSGTILCFGGTTTVTVSGSGGTAPYTGTGTFTVTAGTYSYTVTDANGCTAITNITVSEPTQLNPNSNSGQILCFGGTTSVNVTASGGTPPYSGTGNFTVSAGTYSYTVTDANGCSATTTITVTEPPLLEAASSSGQILCFGGTTTINVSATGGTAPYTGTGSFTVSAGTYSYTVTDANGCISTTSITVTEPPLLESSASTGSILCFGGTTTVNVTAVGGTPPYSGTGNYTVTAGTYTYTVTDANGCTDDVTVSISQPTQLIVDAGNDQVVYFGYAPQACATLGASSSGGTGSASYEWFDDNGVSISTSIGVTVCPSTTTTYTVIATDANGCTASSTVNVCVIDVVCYAGNSNNAKVEVCHVPPGNPSNAHTICISPNAVPAHLATGSTLGSCTEITNCVVARMNQQGNKGKGEKLKDITGERFAFKVYPNPAFNELTISFDQIISHDFSIEVVDMLGRVVISTSPTNQQVETISVERLGRGMYMVRIIDELGNYAVKQFTKS